MILAAPCQASARIPDYLDASLNGPSRAEMEAHLRTCDECRRTLERFREVESLLALDAGVFTERTIRETGEHLQLAAAGHTDPEAQAADGFAWAPAASSVPEAAPRGPASWWMISAAFHLALLLLVALVGMVMMRAGKRDTVLVVDLVKIAPAELQAAPPQKALERPVPLPSRAALDERIPLAAREEIVVDDTALLDELDAAESRMASGTSRVSSAGPAQQPALGVGQGQAAGAFGRPLDAAERLKRAIAGGGSTQTEDAVDAALAWLARHQREDGSWQRHGIRQDLDSYEYRGAVTGLALLAFLGAGHTETMGKHKAVVARGVRWLIAHQAKDGLVCEPGYTHAIAGLALCEAAGMARVEATRAAAQKAVTFSTEVHQHGTFSEKRAWRYYPMEALGDLSVTGWFVLQLKAAKLAGLDVNPAAFEGAARFLDGVEQRSGEGENAARAYGYQTPGHGARTTPIGLVCRQVMGWPQARVQAGAEAFVRRDGLPAWSGGKTADLYRWYYATLCLFQQGGETWARWNEALTRELTASQLHGGPADGGLKDTDGSWDPVGVKYATAWERVGQTALAALCLEVYYRYLPLYR
ncbi:MAG: zf-HC2 domain-containing protein [Planctomycetes bacterium]|nr:zf-HC2 domain-containing protein [Planctomycetota bacterium]